MCLSVKENGEHIVALFDGQPLEVDQFVAAHPDAYRLVDPQTYEPMIASGDQQYYCVGHCQ